MEGTMEQFTEKLAGLVELGKKNKNFLEYAPVSYTHLTLPTN